MQPQRYHVFLQDEAPRIGSGWRIVTVLKGRKWVRLLDERSGRRAKIRAALWVDLEMHGKGLLGPRMKKRRRLAKRQSIGDTRVPQIS